MLIKQFWLTILNKQLAIDMEDTWVGVRIIKWEMG